MCESHDSEAQVPIYTKLDKVPVAVGVIQQAVVAPLTALGEYQVLIIIENLSLTETFTGVTSTSTDGLNGWVPELNDEFLSISPGIPRRMLLPQDRIWVRVLGNFLLNPASVRVTIIYLPPIPFR
jgi:hypothetical protein